MMQGSTKKKDSCIFVTGRKLTLATKIKTAEKEMIVFAVSHAMRGHTVLPSYSIRAKGFLGKNNIFTLP
jgi:hypothetical protein